MSGGNTFLPRAIETVTKAINHDNAKEYEQAQDLYKKALEFFLVALKCETPPPCVVAKLALPAHACCARRRAPQMRRTRRRGRSSHSARKAT